MLRLDAHLHVFAKVSAEFPRHSDQTMPADSEAPVEVLLQEMEEHGVDQAVLVQIGGAELDQHAYLRHCLKAHPERFRGIGLIPTDCSNPAAHMDRLAADGDLIGFRLFDLGGPFDPLALLDIRTTATYPIWQRAAEKDYVLWLYPRAGDSHIIAFLIDAFPQVRVVFNHLMVFPGQDSITFDELGRPQIDTPMPPMTRYSSQRLHQYENVRIHLSGQYAFSKEQYPYRDTAGWHTTLLQSFGADRLMWASDFPWILKEPGYGRLVGILDELLPDLDERDRVSIMGGAAARFLRFPPLSEKSS